MDIVITEDSSATAPSRRMTHQASPEARTRGTIREIRMSGGTVMIPTSVAFASSFRNSCHNLQRAL